VLIVNSSKEQGVSFYRNHIRTFCQSLSTVPGKKRVVVLDDIDIIGEQSQQLFRTCMDQYGRSVHFVASCTDQQKVAECLQSRLLAVKIPALESKSLERIAARVINGEGLTVHNDALNHIISVSQGSARSVISYLEKAELLGGVITLDTAEALCTDISWKEFETYMAHVESGMTMAATHLLYEIHDKGFSVMDILDNFFCFLKQTDAVSQAQVYIMVPVVCKYLMRLHDTYAHMTELAFFTRSVVVALREHSIA
jgi:DNA polymerase III delta prime subunit